MHLPQRKMFLLHSPSNISQNSYAITVHIRTCVGILHSFTATQRSQLLPHKLLILHFVLSGNCKVKVTNHCRFLSWKQIHGQKLKEAETKVSYC